MTAPTVDHREGSGRIGNMAESSLDDPIRQMMRTGLRDTGRQGSDRHGLEPLVTLRYFGLTQKLAHRRRLPEEPVGRREVGAQRR
jgi:hypothetical protein